MSALIVCQWDGEHFVPLKRFAKQCDRDFVVGEIYRLEEINERSANSHRHYFSAIAEAWDNLPDDLAERFQTPDHLRRYALIKSGYHDERSIVTASKAEALRVAAFIKPMDPYAVVAVSEAVVRVYTAKSQSYRAMGKDEFQRSKTAVLEIVSAMIATSQQALSDNAGRAA